MKRDWYAIYDPDNALYGCRRIDPMEAKELNEKGFGIFWTVNEFRGRRQLENLVRINSWYIEIDQGSKASQWERIRKGLIPSLIVESQRGYHVYFDAKDATPGNWDQIVSRRLIPFFQADPAVHDLARILRVPGFYHYKDILKPFRVRTVFESDAIYTEDQVLSFFKEGHSKSPEGKREGGNLFGPRGGAPAQDLWDRIYSMDCEVALERLSGSRYVNHEEYTFKPVANGKLNILVNGETTGCWIDPQKRIGSRSGGGPTIWNWIKWYGYSDSEVYQIMSEIYPEVMEDRKAS